MSIKQEAGQITLPPLRSKSKPVSSPNQELNDWCQALYEAKAPGLVLYGRALGLSHSEAEDVLQETFLALLQLKGRPDDPVNYCVRAFRNRAMNYHRSVWRRLTREWESLSWFEPKADQSAAESAAMRCLAELPPEQREVIVLKIWNEFTFEAIGHLLDVSPNTVAGRYRYGINKLKALLKGKEYDRPEPFGETIRVMDPAAPLH